MADTRAISRTNQFHLLVVSGEDAHLIPRAIGTTAHESGQMVVGSKSIHGRNPSIQAFRIDFPLSKRMALGVSRLDPDESRLRRRHARPSREVQSAAGIVMDAGTATASVATQTAASGSTN